MFEKASRLKLRFDSVRGNLSVEDLWDLPLTNGDLSLDEVAKVVIKKLKETEDGGFIKKKTTENSKLELKLDILKHIRDVKLSESEEAENRAANKAKKEKIMEILVEKEDNSLKRKSKADLEKMLNEL